jgi:small subunit ribosomal protein S27Ae
MSKTHEYYSVEKDGKLERKRRYCSRCGEGTFMAEHDNRFHCGKCGFTEFKPSNKEKQKET